MDLRALIAAHDPQHVVVKIYLPQESPPQEHTLEQMWSAQANGCTIGGYIWCYRDLDPRQAVRDALALLRGQSLSVPVLWLDIETYPADGSIPGPIWIEDAVEEAQALGQPAGIYTSREMWRRAMTHPDNDLFSHLPLWAAQYDGVPDLGAVDLFGGWTHASGKQYISTPIDLDVFDLAVTGGSMRTPEQQAIIDRLRQYATELRRLDFGQGRAVELPNYAEALAATANDLELAWPEL
jgi:hypothetical protein